MNRFRRSEFLHVLGLPLFFFFSLPAEGLAQSCGEMGGNYCSQTGSCPVGYDSLGSSYDCNACCVEQPPPPPGPSCGQMGGNYCSQTASCPAGYDSLGSSYDCNVCCVERPPPPPGPSCGELGGDYCSQTASCPAGYDSLGSSYDCNVCCVERPPPPPGPSCGELGGNYCSQSNFCPAGYDSLGLSSDCSPCCRQQPPSAPSCGALGGDYCGQTGSCPDGHISLGSSNDCSPCCQQPGLTVQIDAPMEGAPWEVISFRAIVTTNPGETILGYAWDFGDGGVSNESSPVHAYGLEGVYVISLGVTTDRDYVTVSRTITVQSQVEGSDNFELRCHPDCIATADFQFDRASNRLVPTARFAIERGPFGHFNEFHPVIHARIKDPTGRIAFDSGFVDAYELWDAGRSPSIHEVEVDFQDFLQIQVPGPRPGRWWLEVRFYYRPIEESFATPIEQGFRVLTEDVSICGGSTCEAFPAKTTVIDGGSATFLLSNPLLGQQYSWAWRFGYALEIGYPGNPSVTLNPTRGTTTTAEYPRWVPIPASQCPTAGVKRAQAMENSIYYLDVKSEPLGFKSKAAEFTVIVPWGYLPEHSVFGPLGMYPAQTHYPQTRIVDLDASDAILCDDTSCTLSVTGLHIGRTPARMEVAPSLLSSVSAFREKALAHEEDHERFFNNPGRCGFQFYTVDSLRAALERCVAEGRCTATVEGGRYEQARHQVIELAREAELMWRVDEDIAQSDARLPLLTEIEAYQVSDRVPPFFLWQGCLNQPTPPCPR